MSRRAELLLLCLRYLKKRQGDRAFVYTPSRPEKQVIRAMVREFVDRVFNGAAEPLLLHLVEDDQLSKEELDEIRRSIPREKKRS